MNLAYHSVVHVLWFFLSKKTNYNHLWLSALASLGLVHYYRERLLLGRAWTWAWSKPLDLGRAWTCRQWL